MTKKKIARPSASISLAELQEQTTRYNQYADIVAKGQVIGCPHVFKPVLAKDLTDTAIAEAQKIVDNFERSVSATAGKDPAESLVPEEVINPGLSVFPVVSEAVKETNQEIHANASTSQPAGGILKAEDRQERAVDTPKVAKSGAVLSFDDASGIGDVEPREFGHPHDTNPVGSNMSLEEVQSAALKRKEVAKSDRRARVTHVATGHTGIVLELGDEALKLLQSIKNKDI